MKKIVTAIVLLHSLAGTAQSSVVSFKNPASLWQPKGFSQATVINLGNCYMVLISGQVPLDSSGNLIGKDDLEKQAEQVFINIGNIITDAGGSINDLVKLTFYVKDISQIQKLREARDKFINTKHPPASTLVEISKLIRDDVLLEADATAIIEKKNN